MRRVIWLLLAPLFLLYGGGSPGAAAPQKEELALPQGGILLLLLPPSSPIRWIGLEGHRVRLFQWAGPSGTGSSNAVKAALVGVDFARSPGSIPLSLHAPQGTERVLLDVTPRSFQVSRLHVARSFVTPPASLLRRITRERSVILNALAPPDGPLRFRRPFILPLDGRITHDFGAYRYLNGRPMARHSGEDIDVSLGTPVHAANDGVVRLAGSFYYDGNMVIIDHGGGLLTEYLHMSDMSVRPGQQVLRGEVIGHVGHTGRVTGPVLHYGAVLHGAHVNPMLLTGLLGSAVSLPGTSP